MDLLWYRGCGGATKTRAWGGHPLPLWAAAAQFCGIRGFRLWPAIQRAEGWDLTGREALQGGKKVRDWVSRGAGLPWLPVYP